MAVMSKELALICLDCPIDFSWDEARLTNLYTPEAYQYMKRLEFKSILTRFDVQSMGGASIEEKFWTVEELAGAEEVFERAEGAEIVGFQLIEGKDGAAGLAICFGEEEIYGIPVSGFMTAAYLCDKIRSLSEKRKGTDSMNTLNLKAQLPHLGLDYGSPVMDGAVAGYLLNPLKDTYDYDDLARDYLGMETEEREVYLDEVKDFAECGLCGTAAVISPVGKIVDHGKEICFPAGMEKMGPVTQKLYETLTGIQMGHIKAPEGWIHVIK